MNKTNILTKKRILIIDDNVQIHQDFKKVLLISKGKESDIDKLEEALLGKTSDLQIETYSIDYASQGEEGLKMVEESIRQKKPYAVAFIDVRMPPGWDGVKTISKIWEIYPEIQIVICTAYSDYSWDEIFNKFGNTDKLLILKKPFDNIEVRQLAYTLTKKWELNKIANIKMNELENIVEERTKELQERNEELDDFAHTVAHDLKNPLGTMMGFADLLLEGYPNLSNDEIQHYLTTIIKSGNKTQQIINSLLLLASVKKEKTQTSEITMGDVVAESIKRLSSMIKKSNAEIALPDVWPIAFGYAPWVEEVWINYLSNAIKYGGSPPRIEIGADTKKPEDVKKGMVRFWVRDNGQGISADDQKLLFKKFERLNQANTQGHGLGLSIVRRIIEKLGGEVGLESDSDSYREGKGSIFHFTLPLNPQPETRNLKPET